MATPDIPKLAFPARIVGGKFAVVEQDTAAEIEGNVQVIALTRPGDRLERPEFGIDDLTFTRAGSGMFDKLTEQIVSQEPRAEFVRDIDAESLKTNMPTVRVRMEDAADGT